MASSSSPKAYKTIEYNYQFQGHLSLLPIAYNFDFPPLVRGPRDVAPWADLPTDIVRLIARRLTAPDYARTLAVCSPWASALRRPLLPLAPHFPFLATIHKGDADTILLVNLHENRSYRLPFLAVHYTVKCVGSCGGWLVFLHNLVMVEALVINPLTGDLIWLPSLKVGLHRDGEPHYLNFHRVVKIVLSDDMSVAVLVYKGFYLAFARAGDDMWTKLHFRRDRTVMQRTPDKIEDVAYNDGKFYVIFRSGLLRSINLRGPLPKATRFQRSAHSDKDEKYEWRFGERFLVSTPSGDLLQVWKRERGRAVEFVVKRFDPEVYSCWHDVTDRMGGWALFRDCVHAMAVRAEDVPGMEGNRIYFAHDGGAGRWQCRAEVVMFDVEKGVFRPCFHPRAQWAFRVPLLDGFRPVWCMPSLF